MPSVIRVQLCQRVERADTDEDFSILDMLSAITTCRVSKDCASSMPLPMEIETQEPGVSLYLDVRPAPMCPLPEYVGLVAGWHSSVPYQS